jgi:hypothetical protein
MNKKVNTPRRRFLKKAALAAYAAPLITSLPAQAAVKRCGSSRHAHTKTAITPGLGMNGSEHRAARPDQPETTASAKSRNKK